MTLGSGSKPIGELIEDTFSDLKIRGGVGARQIANRIEKDMNKSDEVLDGSELVKLSADVTRLLNLSNTVGGNTK